MSDRDFNLPHSLYYRAVWLVADYPRLLIERESLRSQTRVIDGLPRSTKISDPTSIEAVKLAAIDSEIAVVEKALKRIPPEYQTGVYQSTAFRAPFPNTAHINTWKHYKRMFIFYIAVYAGWL